MSGPRRTQPRRHGEQQNRQLACGCAVQSSLPAGLGYTSLELKVSFLKSIGADLPPVRAHGWIVKSGRRAAFAEADVRTVDGDLLATASSTCLVFPIPAA